ncbi:MAG: 16S rRNA (uracil(1498)-N(3))-methyltransferase [Pseudomonadota bacterium]
MRIHRLFIDVPLASDTDLTLGPEAANYLGRALRARPGGKLLVFNGHGGEYHATITTLGRRDVSIRVGEFVDVARESPLDITLLQGLSRGERMDFVVQKATELGVTAIVPIDTEYAGVSLDKERREKRREHFRSIAIAAAQQCGRTSVASVAPITTLARAIADLPVDALRLVADTAPGDAWPADSTQKIFIAVGPEGGFADHERDTLAQHGFLRVNLGPRVLRTETAALTALTVLQSRYGDMTGDPAG